MSDFEYTNGMGIPCYVKWKKPHYTRKADGLTTFGDIGIEIDPTLYPKRKLEVTIEEFVHSFFPEKTEKEVRKLANKLTSFIYKNHDHFGL